MRSPVDQTTPSEPETAMVFRLWPTGDVIALMVEIPADDRGYLCESYEHVGQHGAADYSGVIAQTKPAPGWASAALRSELESIGYRIRVIQREQPCHRAARRREAKAGL